MLALFSVFLTLSTCYFVPHLFVKNCTFIQLLVAFLCSYIHRMCHDVVATDKYKRQLKSGTRYFDPQSHPHNVLMAKNMLASLLRGT